MKEIAIQEITISETRRSLGDISALVGSIKQIGLMNPITITIDNVLISGLHRLEACKVLKWSTIPVTCLDLDELGTELAEIDENLIRNELTVFENAVQTNRRKEIYLILHPETKHGAQGGRGGNKNENDTMSFSKDTAKKTGKTERTVERQAKIGKELKDMAAQIEGTPVEDSQKDLLALTKMEPKERQDVVEKISTGQAKNVKEAKKIIKRKAKKGSTKDLQKYSGYKLYHDDMATTNKITPASIDVIITDPPYIKSEIYLYKTLAVRAMEWLKPGGSLLVMVGQSYLPVILFEMTKHISYQWTIAYLTPGGQSVQLWDRKVNTFWKPVLWFVKEEYKGDWVGDVCKSDPNQNDKRFHDWGQSESGMADLVDRFTYPKQKVLDPFMGAGTTGVVCLVSGRQFIGIEKEEKSFLIAKQRIQETFENE